MSNKTTNKPTIELTLLDRALMETGSSFGWTDENEMWHNVPKKILTQLEIYIQEEGGKPYDKYNPADKLQKKIVLLSVCSFLESIANDPVNLKSYKTEDITITYFYENLQKRINELRRQAMMIQTEEGYRESGASLIYIFND